MMSACTGQETRLIRNLAPKAPTERESRSMTSPGIGKDDQQTNRSFGQNSPSRGTLGSGALLYYEGKMFVGIKL
jgi:hypothetical protein